MTSRTFQSSSTVTAAALSKYSNPHDVYGVVRTAIELLGPIDRVIPQNSDIIIKPNFVVAAPAEDAVTTHPAIIAAVARIAVEAGARNVRIADTPAFGSAKRAARILNLQEHLGDLDVEVCNMTMPKAVSRDLMNGHFSKLYLAQDVLDCDFVINLPKVKAHAQMVFSGAVKNLFGCIPGRRKALMHCQVRNSRDIFARMLVDVACAIQPTLHIADGTVAMEGQGPRNGTPRPWGWITASMNAFAVDYVISQSLGYEVDEVPTLKAGEEMGVFRAARDSVHLIGATWDELRIDTFRKAQLIPVTFNPVRLVRGYVRHKRMMRAEAD